MNSFYKNCEIEVNAVYISPTKDDGHTPRRNPLREHHQATLVEDEENFQVCERSRAIRRDDGARMD